MNISGRTTGPDEVRARAEGAAEYSLERDPRTVWAWALAKVRDVPRALTDLDVRRAAELCVSDEAKTRHPKVQATAANYAHLAAETTRCLDILEAVKPLVAAAKQEADDAATLTEELTHLRAQQKSKWATGDRRGSATAKKIADDIATRLPRLRLAYPVAAAYDAALSATRLPSSISVDAHLLAVRKLAAAMFPWCGRAFFVTPCDVGGSHYERRRWSVLGECTTVALHQQGQGIGFHLSGPGASRAVDLDVLRDAIGHVIGDEHAGWVSLNEPDMDRLRHDRVDVIVGRVHQRKAAP